MYVTNTTEKSEGNEESDPPPVSEEIPTDYSGPFRPYEDICNELKSVVEAYKPCYNWMVGKSDPSSRTIFI